MSPQRRTALVSVGAACLLVVIKLVAGLASSSLGLLAEAAHSGTDLAAALLTFFAVSVAVRPADRGHPYGHAKAQNLAALAEAGFLILVSVGIAVTAILRLAGVVEFDVDPTWWTFAAVALVLAIDASRTMVSLRGARLYRSDALFANALHFGSDFAGTIAVLAGLIAAALDVPAGDSIAALFVSGLVVAAAVRLASRNVDVLMDRSPEDDDADRASGDRDARPARGAPTAPAAASGRRALRGRRHRRRPGRRDRPGPRCGRPRRSTPCTTRLPGIDVVVHVEPAGRRCGDPRARARGCAHRFARARDPQPHRSRRRREHRGLAAPEAARRPPARPARTRSRSRSRLRSSLRSPEVRTVQTHIEPIERDGVRRGGRHRHRRDRGRGTRGDRCRSSRAPLRPHRRRHRRLPDARAPKRGLTSPTRTAGRAAIEERVRRAVPAIADVVVHTEP